jgi:hypothetical protein
MMEEKEALQAFAMAFITERATLKRLPMPPEEPPVWPLEGFERCLSLPLSVYLLEVLAEGLLKTAWHYTLHIKTHGWQLHPALLPGLVKHLPRDRKCLTAISKVLPPKAFEALLQKQKWSWKPLPLQLPSDKLQALEAHFLKHLTLEAQGGGMLHLSSFAQAQDPTLAQLFQDFAREKTPGGLYDLGSYLPSEFWEIQEKRLGTPWASLLKNGKLRDPLPRILCASYAREKNKKGLEALGAALLQSGLFFTQTSAVMSALGPGYYLQCVEKAMDQGYSLKDLQGKLLDHAPFVLSEKLSWRLFALCKEESMDLEFPSKNEKKNILNLAMENMHPQTGASIQSPHWYALKQFLMLKKMNFAALASFTLE